MPWALHLTSPIIVLRTSTRNQLMWLLIIIPASVYNTAMYSVKEAAEKLGLDTSQVRRLLAKGEIKGVKLARDWIVLDLSYKRKRKPRKR